MFTDRDLRSHHRYIDSDRVATGTNIEARDSIRIFTSHCVTQGAMPEGRARIRDIPRILAFEK